MKKPVWVSNFLAAVFLFGVTFPIDVKPASWLGVMVMSRALARARQAIAVVDRLPD